MQTSYNEDAAVLVIMIRHTSSMSSYFANMILRCKDIVFMKSYLHSSFISDMMTKNGVVRKLMILFSQNGCQYCNIFDIRFKI